MFSRAKSAKLFAEISTAAKPFARRGGYTASKPSSRAGAGEPAFGGGQGLWGRREELLAGRKPVRVSGRRQVLGDDRAAGQEPGRAGRDGERGRGAGQAGRGADRPDLGGHVEDR